MPSDYVIAIGNPERGDDDAGHLVARHLRQYRLPGVAIVECSGDAAEVLDLLRRADSAILVDAGRFGAAPGAIRRIDCARRKLPAAAPASSHGFGLAQAIALARALGALPRRCLVYVIAGACWDIGAPVSPAVADAAAAAATMICRDLAPARRRAAMRNSPRARHPTPA